MNTLLCTQPTLYMPHTEMFVRKTDSRSFSFLCVCRCLMCTGSTSIVYPIIYDNTMTNSSININIGESSSVPGELHGLTTSTVGSCRMPIKLTGVHYIARDCWRERTLYTPHTVHAPHCTRPTLFMPHAVRTHTVHTPRCTHPHCTHSTLYTPTLYTPYTAHTPHCTHPTLHTPHTVHPHTCTHPHCTPPLLYTPTLYTPHTVHTHTVHIELFLLVLNHLTTSPSGRLPFEGQTPTAQLQNSGGRSQRSIGLAENGRVSLLDIDR